MKNLIVVLSVFVGLVTLSVSMDAQGLRDRFPSPSAIGVNKVDNSAYLPDLIVTKIRLVPLSEDNRKVYDGKIGVPVDVTFKNVSNQNVTARQSFYVTVHGSRGFEKVLIRGGIQSKQSITRRVFLEMPASFSGQTTNLTATVDGNDRSGDAYKGKIRESNEENNTKDLRTRIPSYKFRKGFVPPVRRW